MPKTGEILSGTENIQTDKTKGFRGEAFFVAVFSCLLLACVAVAVFGRHTALHLTEGFGEITHILKTAPYRNIGNLVAGKYQHMCCLLDAVLFYILYRCGVDGVVEASQTFANTEVQI